MLFSDALGPASRGRTPAMMFALALGGCFGSRRLGPGTDGDHDGRGGRAEPPPSEIDVRRYLGPDYCPEIRIRKATELMRRYESGHEDDAGFVVWQASIGKTARECLYDLQGDLTLRVGVSGRVIAGPKGGRGDVTLPLRITIVKYKEAVLANELYPLERHHPAGKLDRLHRSA